MTSVDSLLHNEFYTATLATHILIQAFESGIVHALEKGHERTIIKSVIWQLVDEILDCEREWTFSGKSVLNKETEEVKEV